MSTANGHGLVGPERRGKPVNKQEGEFTDNLWATGLGSVSVNKTASPTRHRKGSRSRFRHHVVVKGVTVTGQLAARLEAL